MPLPEAFQIITRAASLLGGRCPPDMSPRETIVEVFTSAGVSRANYVHTSRPQLERRNRNGRSKIDDFAVSRAVRLLSRDLWGTAGIRHPPYLIRKSSRVEYSFRAAETVGRLEIIARTIVLYVIRGAVRSID